MPSFTGTWVKDKPNSDSMDPVCELMGLSWILKTAIRIISRMEVRGPGGRVPPRMPVRNGLYEQGCALLGIRPRPQSGGVLGRSPAPTPNPRP